MSYSKVSLSIIIFVIMLIAIMSTLSLRSDSSPIIATNDLPDAYMEQVNALILDKEGNPNVKIATPRMLHFTKNDISELVDPQLVIYRQSPEPWFVAAKYARAMNGIEHVIFWEDVTLSHQADNKNPDTTIRTSRLTLYPSEQKASTDEFITLIQPNFKVKATGMRADMAAGSVKLLKDARGEYVPDA